MKKTITIIFVAVILIWIMFFAVTKSGIVEYIFDQYISVGLDRSMVEESLILDQQAVVYWWKDCIFLISKYKSDRVLSIWANISEHNHDLKQILMGVSDYKKKDGKLFVVAKEGYAVIDDDNLCRVFIIEEYDSYRTQKYIENERIKYIDSMEEFSEKEFKVFEKMKKN